ncbi:hypothetical protein [Candidatus Electronema sp. JM]|uniref:hypothetical protein n=1 Tax=Candidatus Electronema sp. JM TaxID=3401571 RepID=UPI003AA99724
MIEELLFMLFEKSEKVWRIGYAMLFFVFSFLTFLSMQSALQLTPIDEPSSILNKFELVIWIPYAGPIICLLLAVYFGVKACLRT